MIALGKIIKPHGVHGEAKIKPFLEDVLRSLTGKTLTLSPEKGGPALRLKLESVRGAGKTIIVKLEGLDTPERVKELCPATLSAPREMTPDLPAGEYYYEEIVGLPVYDTKGEQVGELEDVILVGERDVWIIRKTDGGEMMVPHIPEVVKKVDIASGAIVIEPMEEI